MTIHLPIRAEVAHRLGTVATVLTRVSRRRDADGSDAMLNENKLRKAEFTMIVIVLVALAIGYVVSRL